LNKRFKDFTHDLPPGIVQFGSLKGFVAPAILIIDLVLHIPVLLFKPAGNLPSCHPGKESFGLHPGNGLSIIKPTAPTVFKGAQGTVSGIGIFVGSK
jgi:hypothetical protein